MAWTTRIDQCRATVMVPALLVKSLTHVSGAVASVQNFAMDHHASTRLIAVH